MENSCEISKKSRIPKSVKYILVNILLERYSSTGASAVLLLYLNTKLDFDQGTSTAIFHSNEVLNYFLPIFGAILADSYFGIFKVLTGMTFVYAVGMFVVAITSIEMLNLPRISLTFIGLAISVVGNGSIRANLTAFGGNQYKLPEQAENLKLYFTIQIVFLKFGSLLGRFLNPMIREDVKCFAMDNCYPLAFGAPSIVMFIAFLILLFGRKKFINKPVTENVFVKVCGCIYHGIDGKIKSKNDQSRTHWIEYADGKYTPELISQTKTMLKLLVLLFPIPIYWCVYMMQSSKWVFQATRMNGNLGWYKIKPDQMIALNPIFAIILMPLCNFVFYPLLSKLGFKSLLHRIIIGIFLCCLAFIIAIFVEIKIQSEYISMLWLFPQYAVLALSENFAFTSLLSFAYSEAPANMKTVMTSFVYFTIAIGNLIISIVSGARVFTSQVTEFAFFVGLLFSSMILFIILASRFKNEKNENENVRSEKNLSFSNISSK